MLTFTSLFSAHSHSRLFKIRNMYRFWCISLSVFVCFLDFTRVAGQNEGAEVEIVLDTSQAPDLAELGIRVKQSMEMNYGWIRNLMWTEAYIEPGNISLKFSGNLEGTHAYSFPSERKILASVDYFRKNQNDDFSLFHEFIYVLQQNKLCPAWISKGMADLIATFVYGAERLSKPLDWAGQHYSQGYLPAAYFINWIDKNPPDHLPSGFFSSWLHGACRVGGSYSEENFKRITGKSFDNLWRQMIYSRHGTNFHIRFNYRALPEEHGWAQSLGESLEKWYPEIRDFLHSPTFEELDFVAVSVTNEELAVSPSRKAIRGGADFTAELQAGDFQQWHTALITLIQQYKDDPCPEWLTTGIRDLTLRREERRWNAHPNQLHYYSNDAHSAYVFLRWLNANYRPQNRRMSYWLNRRCREGTYTSRTFRRLTGKNADQLWNEMMRSLRVQQG